MKKILIGNAWVYANGSLHIGHVAGLLPGDVLARYHRATGDQVCFVSGSDCHGTPVAIRAKKEHKTPQEISDFYHEEFKECFQRLGFSYDIYTKTSSQEHKDFVADFHKKLYKSPYVYEKEVPQAFCEQCGTFLADRFVIGECPKCGEEAHGDQCDICGVVLEPENLQNPLCAICGRPISFRPSRHLYIAISALERQLKELVDTHPTWRKNAITFTNKYISEGLRDRALTRDLDWGIPVPKESYENKTIYIWAENVLGYLSASLLAVNNNLDDFAKLWGSNSRHYYVHGKDNIPFPEGSPDAEINGKIKTLYQEIGRLIEKTSFKDALRELFDFIRWANKYFDTKQPWITRTADEHTCKDTLYQCVQIIANLAGLLYPFLPFSSEKICTWLEINNKWEPQSVPSGYQLPEIEILFQRIDKKVIEEESAKLKTL